MKNSYTTLHRNLDTKIAELESHPYDNQSLIKDLKKKKLQLKDKLVVTVNEQLELFVHEEKTRAKKLMDSMIHEQKRTDKKRRKSRKKRIQSAIRRIDKVSLSG